MPNLDGDNQFEDINLDWYNPVDTAYQPSVFDFTTTDSVGVMYSMTFTVSQMDNFYFRVTNNNTQSTSTIEIPYNINILRNSDTLQIGRGYSNTLKVLPYKGIKTNMDTLLFCDRVDFTVDAWDYCSSDNKLISLALVAPTDTNYFKLEYWFDTGAGYYPVSIPGSGILYGTSDVFTKEKQVKFRVVNNDTTSGQKIIKFILSILKEADLMAPALYTTDTLVIKLAPLPTLTVTQLKDSVECAPENTLTVEVGQSNCDNEKQLKVVIDNYVQNSLAGLFDLSVNSGAVESINSIGVWYGASPITRSASTATFTITSKNERDTVVPLVYTIYLVNVADSVELLSSVQDTLYLKPKPYFKWLDNNAPDTVSCEEEFRLIAVLSDVCSPNVGYAIITPDDTTHVNWNIISHTDAGTIPSGLSSGRLLLPINNNVSDTITFKISSLDTTNSLPYKVGYKVEFMRLVGLYPYFSEEIIGRTYQDSIVVMPLPGVEVKGLESGTLVCERQPFTITAWNYCTSDTLVAMLQLTNPEDTAYFMLEYEYPNKSGNYDTVKNYNGGGYIYGLTHPFVGLSDSIRFFITNNDTTDSDRDVKYTVSIVDKTSLAVLYTSDTSTFTLKALPKIEVVAP
ncbi:MAG: hypothetical protein LBD91_01815, partial [Prevotellaceae bacterium]|nr:hypothetical protein [Prevotellaceae bacterium]